MRNKNEEIKGCVFILRRASGKMLLQFRDDKSEFYPNQWNFPGGACEDGEKTIDAVIREAKEEYDIDLKKSDCISLMSYKLPHRDYSTEVFVCNLDDDQSPKLIEGGAMKWMELEDIKKIELGFGQECIISYLEKFLKYQ